MYYAFIQNNKINGCGECQQLTPGVQNIEISEEVYNDIEKYIWDGEAIVLNPDWDNIKLKEVKDAKLLENDTIRDETLLQGVYYKDVLFDSDTDQKINLLAIVSTMGDEDTIVWYGMDNVPLECTKLDLINIGGLITALHSFCWNKNAELKSEIHEAETIEDIEAIVIDYNMEMNNDI